MSKFKEQVLEDKNKFEFPTYSNQELWELNDLIEKKYNGGRTSKDIQNFMKDEGALSENGSVYVTGYRQEYNFKEKYFYTVIDYPTKFLILQDKYEKANRLLGKKEYAIKMSTKELSENMKVINETVLDEF